MKMKKLMSMVLLGTLAGSLLAGCGKSNAMSADATEGSRDGVMELQILSLSATSDYMGSDVAKMLEKKYNVKFKVIDLDEFYMDTYQTMIDSGDTPDYYLWIPKSNFGQFQKQGAFAPIPDGLVKEKSPQLFEYFQKFVNQNNPFVFTSVDGVNYGLPVPWTIGKDCNVTGIREDWLNNVGITKLPETIEEVHDALLAFRNNDPDKNGVKDTYGWSAMLDVSGAPIMFTPVFGAYGAYPGIFYAKNGKIVRGEVQPEAKEALQTLHDWYEEDIIDPEFVVDTADTIREKWVSEKYGYVADKWFEMIPEKAFWSGFFYDKLVEKNPNAKLTVLTTPKGKNGEAGMVQVNPMRGDMVNFSAKMADQPEKMAKYIEVFGDASFNPDTLLLEWKGTEGVTFNKTPDGGYEWTKDYEDPEKREAYGVGFTSMATNFQDYNQLAKFMTAPEYMELRKEVTAKAVGKFDLLAPVTVQTWTENADALNRFATQSYVEFITGARSLDEFDSFVNEWYTMGGTEVMKEAQEAYDKIQQ